MPRTSTSEITARKVGAEIRRARRESRDWTQAELAARLDADQSYVANVEAGRKNLTLGQLTRIARALDAGLEIGLVVGQRHRVEVPEAAP